MIKYICYALILFTAVLCGSLPAASQDPAEIFGKMLGIVGELQKQQEYEKRQALLHQQWNLCFQQNDLIQCRSIYENRFTYNLDQPSIDALSRQIDLRDGHAQQEEIQTEQLARLEKDWRLCFQQSNLQSCKSVYDDRLTYNLDDASLDALREQIRLLGLRNRQQLEHQQQASREQRISQARDACEALDFTSCQELVSNEGADNKALGYIGLAKIAEQKQEFDRAALFAQKAFEIDRLQSTADFLSRMQRADAQRLEAERQKRRIADREKFLTQCERLIAGSCRFLAADDDAKYKAIGYLGLARVAEQKQDYLDAAKYADRAYELDKLASSSQLAAKMRRAHQDHLKLTVAQLGREVEQHLQKGELSAAEEGIERIRIVAPKHDALPLWNQEIAYERRARSYDLSVPGFKAVRGQISSIEGTFVVLGLLATSSLVFLFWMARPALLAFGRTPNGAQMLAEVAQNHELRSIPLIAVTKSKTAVPPGKVSEEMLAAEKADGVPIEAESLREIDSGNAARDDVIDNAEGSTALESDEYIDRAEAAIDDKDYQEAISHLSKAISIDASNDIAHAMRAIAYHKIGELDSAIADLKKAMEIDPDNISRRYWLAELRFEVGQVKDALADCASLIEVDPGFADAYHLRGLIRKDGGANDQAISDISTAINLKDDKPHFYFSRGNAYLENDEADKAIADYNKGFELAGESHYGLASIYHNRGCAYYLKKEDALALSDLKKAVELDPTQEDYRSQLDIVQAEIEASQTEPEPQIELPRGDFSWSAIGSVHWLGTLRLLLARGFAAGIVGALFFVVMTLTNDRTGGVEDVGSLLVAAPFMPFVWAAFATVFALGALFTREIVKLIFRFGGEVAQSIAGFVFLGVLIASMACIMLGDPLVYFLNRAYPQILQVRGLRLFNFRTVIFVFDPEKVQQEDK